MSQNHIEIILLRQWALYLTMPVFIASADGRLVYYNEPAERLLGRRYDEAGEMPLGDMAELFALRTAEGEVMAARDMPLGIAMTRRHPSHGRVRYRGLDGVERTVEISAFPIETVDGDHLGAFAIFWEDRK